ncbi:MAG: hypothetical protein AAGJ81_06790 [Verrucomicrobiota bacterium]
MRIKNQGYYRNLQAFADGNILKHQRPIHIHSRNGFVIMVNFRSGQFRWSVAVSVYVTNLHIAILPLHFNSTLLPVNKLCICLLVIFSVGEAGEPAIRAFDTGYTVMKVRSGSSHGTPFIVGSTYEGTILGMRFDGSIAWTNPLSGYMNHDLWCGDLDGDGIDEILAANADGSIYCLNVTGDLLWSFKKNDVPMNAVCIIRDGDRSFIACGGYDLWLYYLDSNGELLESIHSETYSKEVPWGRGGDVEPPQIDAHTINFLRPLKRSDGTEVLVMDGIMNSHAGTGTIYLFEPLSTEPFASLKSKLVKPIGHLSVADSDGDGNGEIFLGTSNMIMDSGIEHIHPFDETSMLYDGEILRHEIDNFGYRVWQTVFIGGSDGQTLTLVGSSIVLHDREMNPSTVEVLEGTYSFNDIWHVPNSDLLLLASVQSGGSCIYIIDTTNKSWKEEYERIDPPGKIARIKNNTDILRNQLKNFTAPATERNPLPVHIGLNRTAFETNQELLGEIAEHSDSPTFHLNYWELRPEKWDRSSIESEKYRERRDARRSYVKTQDEILDGIREQYEGFEGISYWGGHGNDPFFFSMDTRRKMIDAAEGKRTAIVFPELEDRSEEAHVVVDELLLPLAKYAEGKDVSIYIRTKNIFWFGNVYEEYWEPFISGEFADVFVPLMEETSAKTMDISVAAELGIWASGVTNRLGTRTAWDNPSFDRTRQFSHQRLANHFLRNNVYSVASGATELNTSENEYTSLLWELIAKGALYVPKRDEIVSFSPVHLSVSQPNEEFLEEGANFKWTTFYDPEKNKDNPMVFGRMNGTWPGAANTPWDFSTYAAGVKDRRQNFLPPYENGVVLITPPQNGPLAESDAPRGKLTDHIHPLYQDIMVEYYTNGKDYLSPDGLETFSANGRVYESIRDEIEERSQLLPLTVSGEVAWVTAQSSPNHLRLTLIDSGYLNPDERIAEVQFHTINPVAIRDVISGERFPLSDSNRAFIDIPIGLFRFIEIEFEGDLSS